MPDKNFEEQARDMANGFEIKPNPEVWQNVHNAIQEPRRKRRFVLWRWLLPLGLLGGSIAFFALTKNNAATQIVKTSLIQQKAPGKTSRAHQLGPQTNTNPEITGEDRNTTAIT